MVPLRRRTAQAALVAFALVVAAAAPAEAFDVERNSYSGEAIEGFDPVAYWTTGKPTMGSRAFSYDWEGAVWCFASAKNRALFESNPERYAPAYGGHDAYEMSQGIKADIHPFIFKIENKRLYLFFAFATRNKFLADPTLAQKAATNWAALNERYF
jgi:YHS domain-containing protein